MLAEHPEVTSLGEGGLFKLRLHIEVIFLDATLYIVPEQILQLLRIKAGEGDVEVRALQVSDDQSEFFCIPFAADLVQGDVERLFLLGVHVNDHDIHLGDAHVRQHLQALVAADHATGLFIPDDRLHIAKLLDGALQLFIFRISGLQILTRIVVSREQVFYIFLFNIHTKPHSANFSKPPMERM